MTASSLHAEVKSVSSPYPPLASVALAKMPGDPEESGDSQSEYQTPARSVSGQVSDSDRVTATALHTRFSSSGAALKVVGVIVDSLVGLDLRQATIRQMRSGLSDNDAVTVVDGILNDRWHLVIAQRPAQPPVGERYEPAATIKALRLLGVRQVMSGAIGDFDGLNWARSFGSASDSALEFIDFADAPELAASVGATSCDRLRSAALFTLERHGFELLSDDIQPFLKSVTTAEERSAARSFGMCFGAVDVIRPLTDEQEAALNAALLRGLTQTFDAISPLASCACAQTIDL